MKLSSILAAGCAACICVAAPAAAQIILNVNSWVPPAHVLLANITVPFCNEVQAATQARVKCNVLPKAVVAPPQTLDAVKDGLADLSFIVHGYTPGRFILTEAVELPFRADSAATLSVAYQRVHERLLAKSDEHKGVHVLAVFTHGPGQIYVANRAVTSVRDLNGLKIRVGNRLVNDIARALGAVPLLKPAPESYELLSQGVADGVFFPKESPQSFKLLPLIKHATYVPGGFYNTSFALVMNPAKWNAITKRDQEAINRLAGVALARRAGAAWDAADVQGEKALRAAAIAVATASPEFVAEVKSRTQALEQAWIAKAKAKGVDGAEIIAALRSEIAAASK